MKLILKLFVMMFLTSSAFAGSDTSSGVVTVKVVFVYTTYLVVEVNEEILPNPAGCTSSRSSSRVFVSEEDLSNGRIYGALMAAKATGAPVTLGIKGSVCRAWGDGTIPALYRVDLR